VTSGPFGASSWRIKWPNKSANAISNNASCLAPAPRLFLSTRCSQITSLCASIRFQKWSFLASLHGPKSERSRGYRCNKVHRQEGAQRQGGLAGKRDQSVEKVSSVLGRCPVTLTQSGAQTERRVSWQGASRSLKEDPMQLAPTADLISAHGRGRPAEIGPQSHAPGPLAGPLLWPAGPLWQACSRLSGKLAQGPLCVGLSGATTNLIRPNE